ncbi:MAG: type I-F CRISPR-associated protein Csy1 [Sulfurimonas sp.]|nr:type I-F CRISPR-associated protein Csy1 [Sulfurimonas sp.]
MTEQAVSKFFEERKEIWIKKNQKASMFDDEVLELQEKCNKLFTLEEWLPSASKRAGQMSISTHPCTFSHPSARRNKNGDVTPIIADVALAHDGLLRSGNVEVQSDALGNAAALDVYKFLNLEMSDGKKLIEHIEAESKFAKSLLKINSIKYEYLKDGFLEMVSSSSVLVTSGKIKQVYFPVESDYHQLSILSNSGIIYHLKKRIDTMRFGDEVKEAREKRKKEEFSELGYSEIYDLTTIGYGGTKPQNISVLNSQNGGKAYLLRSMPPVLKRREIYFPKRNFFQDSLRWWEVSKIFDALYRVYAIDYNNVNIRNGRKYRYEKLMDKIVEKMWDIRSVSEEQYYEPNSKLKSHQKIWLCHEYEKERESEDTWLDKLEKEITVWIVKSYEKRVNKQGFKLGTEERKDISKVVNEHREALR